MSNIQAQHFSLLTESVREYAIFMVDPDGRILTWNKGAQRIKGYSADDIIGKHISTFYLPEEIAWGKPDEELRVARTEGYCEDEGWRVRKDGTKFWAYVTITAMHDDDGRVVGFVKITRDMTERRNNEQRVKDNETRLRNIVNHAVDGIITIDEMGLIESVNPAVERIFGYAADELIGRNVKVLMPNPYHDAHDGYLENYRRTGVRKIIGIGREVLGRRSDGAIFPVDLAVSEVRLGSRRLFTGIIRDITERKRAEKEREQLLASERAARAEAERANRAKDEFIAVLSHELRTPLTPALLTLSLLQSDPDLHPKFLEDVESIRRNVNLEARLIDDLLDLTRIATGKLSLTRETADLHLLVRNAVNISCPDDGVPVMLDLAATAHYVYCDPARIQQVFWNILSNAQKYTPIGGRVRVRSSNPAGDRIRVEVEDTGRGIEPDLLPNIFKAFEQGTDHAAARRFGGLGLGLAISKAIIEAHGGTISANSAGKGKGAKFAIEMVAVPVPTATSAPSKTQMFPRSMRPLNILVVEDHEQTLSAITKLLSQMGHQPSAATSVREALELAADNEFDLIISDLGLPDGSGHEIMRHLKQRADVKGIALSGYGMPEDIRKSKEAGFAEHITKPVDLHRLVAVVDQFAR